MLKVNDSITVNNMRGTIIGIINAVDQFNEPTYHYKVHFTRRFTGKSTKNQWKSINVIQNCNRYAVE